MHRVQFMFIAGVLTLCAVGSLTLRSSDVRAHDGQKRCVAYVGPFSAVEGPPCESPIGLCTHGLLQGEYSARYDFTFLTLDSANDASDPTKFVYTGTSVATPTDGSGELYTNDTGVIHMPTDGSPANFVTKAIIDHGKKHHRNTSGAFVASGSLDLATGQATGSFTAVLCRD